MMMACFRLRAGTIFLNDLNQNAVRNEVNPDALVHRQYLLAVSDNDWCRGRDSNPHDLTVNGF